MSREMTPRMTIEERDEKCAQLGHPSATYNPWVDRTWCICGLAQRNGDVREGNLACCGGPLDRWKNGAA